jgi:hypothetical protein
MPSPRAFNDLLTPALGAPGPRPFFLTASAGSCSVDEGAGGSAFGSGFVSGGESLVLGSGVVLDEEALDGEGLRSPGAEGYAPRWEGGSLRTTTLHGLGLAFLAPAAGDAIFSEGADEDMGGGDGWWCRGGSGGEVV